MEQRRNDRHRANLIMKKLLLLLLTCSTITGWAASSTFSGVTVTGTANLNQIYVSGTAIGAGSNVIYVSKSSQATDTRTGLNKSDVTRPFATITAAKNAASAGDLVLVQSGTYPEALNCPTGVDWYFYPGAILAPSIETNSYALNIANGVSCNISGNGTFTFIDEELGASTSTVFIAGTGTVSFECDNILNPSSDTATDNWTLHISGAKSTYVNIHNPITNFGDASVVYDIIEGKNTMTCPAINPGFYDSIWVNTSSTNGIVTINCPDVQGSIDIQGSAAIGKFNLNSSKSGKVTTEGPIIPNTALNISDIQVPTGLEPSLDMFHTSGTLTVNNSIFSSTNTYSIGGNGGGRLVLNECILLNPINPSTASASVISGVYTTQSGTNNFIELSPTGTGTARVSGTSLGSLAFQNGTFSGTTSGLHSGTSSGLNTGDQTASSIGAIATLNGSGTNTTITGNGSITTTGTVSATRVIAIGLTNSPTAPDVQVSTGGANVGGMYSATNAVMFSVNGELRGTLNSGGDFSAQGRLGAPVGSVGLPTFRFTGITAGTGMWSNGAGQIGFAGTGTNYFGLNVAGGFYVGTPAEPMYIVPIGTGSLTAVGTGTIARLGGSYQATAAGTAYTLTASYASVDFGTTDPSITLVAAGNYYLYVNVSTAFNAATFAGVQSVSAKLRRTSGTPADIGTPRSQPLPVITALTGAGPSVMVGPFPYTATANDVVTVQAILSATPGAGSVTVDACEITAIPR